MARTTNKTSTKPVWLKLSEEDLEKIIEELSEKYSSAQIGLILRDQYGVPTTKVYGKKLSSYLKETGKYTDVELVNAQKRFDNMKEHLSNNKQDKKAKHKLQKLQSHLNAMNKYYAK